MASPTGGVKAFSVQGRLYRERERLNGMTEEEREWRAQWVKDQHLSGREPVHIPGIYQASCNPIRRTYRLPLNLAAQYLEPFLGVELAQNARAVTGKLLMIVSAVYAGAYYMKYNSHDWTRKGGWRVMASRREILPGDPDFSKLPDRSEGADYSSRGFKDSPI